MKKIPFGMPTLLELETLEENAKLCRELGLDFVEISLCLPGFQPFSLDAEALKGLSRHCGFTVHFDDDLDPAAFNPLVAEAHCRTAIAAIRLARKADIPLLNLHLAAGGHFTLPGEKVYLYNRYRDHYLRAMERFRELCASEIGDSGILLCVENTGGFRDYQREVIDLLLEAPCFGLTLDIGHNHTAKSTDLPFLLERKNRLRHMHVHDGTDHACHLVLGEGRIDIPAMLGLAEETGCRCVLETKTAAGLRASTEYLRGLGRL